MLHLLYVEHFARFIVHTHDSDSLLWVYTFPSPVLPFSLSSLLARYSPHAYVHFDVIFPFICVYSVYFFYSSFVIISFSGSFSAVLTSHSFGVFIDILICLRDLL